MRCAPRARVVIVALQMQHAVHDEVRVVRIEALALRPRFARARPVRRARYRPRAGRASHR